MLLGSDVFENGCTFINVVYPPSSPNIQTRRLMMDYLIIINTQFLNLMFLQQENE